MADRISVVPWIQTLSGAFFQKGVSSLALPHYLWMFTAYLAPHVYKSGHKSNFLHVIIDFKKLLLLDLHKIIHGHWAQINLIISVAWNYKNGVAYGYINWHIQLLSRRSVVYYNRANKTISLLGCIFSMTKVIAEIDVRHWSSDFLSLVR